MPTDSTVHRLIPHLRRVAMARDKETGDGQLLGAFVATRDDAAFATLVRRHGPMVLGVCRRVVGDPHLAEDAFQATFLVLARRAAVVRPRHLVGPWLYGVAYRTALKARSSAARRNAKEKQVDAMPHPPVSPEEAWTDLQPVLDAELARLPDKYRIPVLLCDLGGRPQRDVARELKLPPATLANRLAAARRLLARRLNDRGITLSAAAIASALGWHAATSAVSPSLSAATVKAACAAAAGTAVGLPVPVVQLSDGVMRMFVLSKLKTVAAGVATCVALLAGLGLVASSSLRANPDEKPAKEPAPTKSADPHRPPQMDDLTFLRRTSLDLRGTLPSVIEAHYFVADKDAKKRTKIVEWMLPEHGKQKTTAACQSCHTGVVFADLDQDGWLDVFVADGIHEKLYTRAMWAQLMDPAASKQAREERDRARAELQAAEARFKALAERLNVQSDAAKTLLEEAKAKVAGAKANLDNYEKRLAADDERGKLGRWIGAINGKNARDPDKSVYEWAFRLKPSTANSDVEFLRRVLLDVTGQPPTTVEQNYFQADTDPKKREKLLELLRGQVKGGGDADFALFLKDPDVQKRWSEFQQKRADESWKKAFEKYKAAAQSAPAGADRLDRLLVTLLESKKSDDQILDAICLATMARFPAETEKKLILEGLKGQPDRKAAWAIVLKTFASTQEARAHGEGLSRRAAK
jgi:RNA polymerase sigma factor (sigma-70 family)